MSFDEEEKRQCCGMISLGCDRQTACHYLGKSAGDLHEALQQDEQLRKRLLRAEAMPEITHMKNLNNASKETKNWRASVWWLEHCRPARYGKRPSDSLTAAQLQKFVDELAHSIADEVHDPQDHQRLVSRLEQLNRTLQESSFHQAVEPADLDCEQQLKQEVETPCT